VHRTASPARIQRLDIKLLEFAERFKISSELTRTAFVLFVLVRFLVWSAGAEGIQLLDVLDGQSIFWSFRCDLLVLVHSVQVRCGALHDHPFHGLLVGIVRPRCEINGGLVDSGRRGAGE